MACHLLELQATRLHLRLSGALIEYLVLNKARFMPKTPDHVNKPLDGLQVTKANKIANTNNLSMAKYSTHLDKMIKKLKPSFSELTVYLTTINCVLVLVAYPDIRALYFWELRNVWLLVITFFAAIGMVLSLVHVFIRQKKTVHEKMAMGAFVLAAHGTAGIAAGIDVLSGEWSVEIIFPIWNFIMGVYLIYQIGLIDEEIITDEETTLLEVVIATMTLFLVFSIAYFWLNSTWAITFSICMCYSSLVTILFTRIIDFIHLSRDTI